MNQINIFDEIYETFKFKPGYKVKLFEAFAGVGCQRMAIDRLNVDYESVGISEIDKYAIKSYMAIHGETKNYGSICDIVGGQLPNIDIFTYSFPCTDLSKAGKQKGLNQNTRSGLVYEVLRILHELNELNNLPKVLIMENVVDLVQIKFIKQFNEIQFELERLGYKNYTQVLNAKDYGIAQNRERVFMVSILGDYNYKFPNPIKLEKKLKDYLEDEVDEKYYISDKKFKYFTSNGSGKYPRGERFSQNLKNAEQCDFANTITTREGDVVTSNFVINDYFAVAQRGRQNGQELEISNRKYANAITTIKKDSMVCFKKCIRQFTPLECWRLMGISDEDFKKAKEVCSRNQIIKQAGNGIVVDVFVAILKKLF